MRHAMSDRMRAGMDELLDDLYGWLVDELSDDRGLAPERLRELFDHGFMSAEHARQAGLADAVLHAAPARELVEKLAGESLTDLSLSDYLEESNSGWFSKCFCHPV